MPESPNCSGISSIFKGGGAQPSIRSPSGQPLYRIKFEEA